MTPDFSRHFRLWSIPVYVLVLTLVTQVIVVQVKYLTRTILSQCLTFSVCCLNLNLLCLTHDLLRQVRLPPVFGLSSDYFLNLHARIFSCFESLHLPVPSSLRLSVWRTYLQEYVDYGVCDFLEFGWPVGFDYSRPLPIHTNFHNHKGATEFPAAVDAYLSSEIAHHTVIGPFSHNPFSCPVAVSPLNSVPKPNITERRIILDLSCSVGSSVTDGISSGLYLAQEFARVYLTVDLIADRVAALGPGCLLFTDDLHSVSPIPCGPLRLPAVRILME